MERIFALGTSTAAGSCWRNSWDASISVPRRTPSSSSGLHRSRTRFPGRRRDVLASGADPEGRLPDGEPRAMFLDYLEDPAAAAMFLERGRCHAPFPTGSGGEIGRRSATSRRSTGSSSHRSPSGMKRRRYLFVHAGLGRVFPRRTGSLGPRLDPPGVHPFIRFLR